MNDFLKLLLSLSLSGTMLILLLFLLRPLYQNRLSKHWQYYIWLVVIARLLLPWTPNPGPVGNLFLQIEYTLNNLSQESDSLEGITDTPQLSALPDSDSGLTQKTDLSNPDIDLTQEDNHAASTDLNARFLASLWLTVALLLLVRKVTIYQSFVKYIHAGSSPVEDIHLLERFGQIMSQNKIRGKIELYTNSLVSSPLLIGFIHPRIVLPDTEMSRNDFYCTVLHELTHYKRRDMFYKWLIQLTLCLHWFNPFIYLMAKEINRLCELSCDERVISILPENTRIVYGDTLLHAIGVGGSYKDTLSCVTLYESKKLLKGRLEAIMKYRKKTRGIQIAAAVITFALFATALSVGAYAAPGNSSINSMKNKQPSPSDATAPDSTFLYDEEKGYYVYTAPDNKYTIFYQNNIYCILADGATMADCPTGGVAGDVVLLRLVYKDYYYSYLFNEFDTPDDITSQVNSWCRSAIQENRMTEAQADLMADATRHIIKFMSTGPKESGPSAQEPDPKFTEAKQIVGMNGTYYYRQSAYFQKPYIIELGWNLSERAQKAYDVLQVPLDDGSAMPVYFDASCKRFMSDEDAVSSIARLLSGLCSKAYGIYEELPIQAPFISGLEYVGDADLDSLAKEYYEKKNYSYFTAIFLELDGKTQQEYLERTFRDKETGFFMCCMDALVDEGIQGDTVERYVLKSYQEDDIAFFSCLCDMLDDGSKKQWIERCTQDGRTNYLYVLKDDDEVSSDETYLSDILEEKGLFEEYGDNGIVPVKNDYYYRGQRVRILLDARADGSFKNFAYSNRGTVDIRIQRDETNAITFVTYLSKTEANEILDDIDGATEGSYSAFPLSDDEAVSPIRQRMSKTPLQSND